MTQYITYKDNKNKSRSYILKDGSYSKKLRIGLLKKPRSMGEKCYHINTLYNILPNTTRLLLYDDSKAS